MASREVSQRLQELQEQHLREIKQFADRTYQQSHREKFNADEMLVKKMRRELDELRRVLTQKNEQIEDLMEEKNILMKEKSVLELRVKQETEKLYEDMKNYKREIEETRGALNREEAVRHNSRIRDQEREIAGLKNKL